VLKVGVAEDIGVAGGVIVRTLKAPPSKLANKRGHVPNVEELGPKQRTKKKGIEGRRECFKLFMVEFFAICYEFSKPDLHGN